MQERTKRAKSTRHTKKKTHTPIMISSAISKPSETVFITFSPLSLFFNMSVLLQYIIGMSILPSVRKNRHIASKTATEKSLTTEDTESAEGKERQGVANIMDTGNLPPPQNEERMGCAKSLVFYLPVL